MRLLRTGHEIADTVSDMVGDLPDGDYVAGYGILRGTADKFKAAQHWFEIDRGMWGAGHYDGLYRISYKGTQPKWGSGLSEPHGLLLEPWRKATGERVMILPPTPAVSEFFGIDTDEWILNHVRRADREFGAKRVLVRHKGSKDGLSLDGVSLVMTFNSSLAVDALQRGIPVISDPEHSSIGSYCAAKKTIDGYDRDEVLDFISAHQFKLGDRRKIWKIIDHYITSL